MSIQNTMQLGLTYVIFKVDSKHNEGGSLVHLLCIQGAISIIIYLF